jgi:hypothetical protein
MFRSYSNIDSNESLFLIKCYPFLQKLYHSANR